MFFIKLYRTELGSNIPAVFGLLPNKNSSTYTHFFRVVEGLAEDMFKGNVDFVRNYKN
jgi:hypothetical protein